MTAMSPFAAQPRNGAHCFALAEAYRPAAGGWDECMAADGTIRPAWRNFAEQVEAIGAAGLHERFAQAQAQLVRSGVVHRVYGDDEGARPWPLSPMPVILAADEWERIAAGIVTRAECVNALLCDAYGAAHFVADGTVPAALYAGSPEFARPMVRAPHFDPQPLRFYAADLARGTDGQWRVLSDRTQAPSGAGYALENRLATAHALPDVHRKMGVASLTGFFQDFAAHLVSLKRHPDARIALLSPGPMNETWFEHSRLARELGLVLVEGSDLIVRDGQLFIRTVAGLQPCEVIWRRVDSDFADPLEFNTRSRLGVPGLAEAARQGNVTVVNAFGSGLAESRAWMSALPAFAAGKTDRNPVLPGQTTLWGIDDETRCIIADRFDSLVIGSAFGAVLPGIGNGSALGASLSHEDREALRARLRCRGVDIVAQEPVALSTTPVFENGTLVPRPFVLRVFAAFTGTGWQIMPGGLARVADTGDARAVSLQHGGRSADVWVVAGADAASRIVVREHLPPQARREDGCLPSRAADNLFWLGRYVERTEFMLRLARAALARGDRDVAGIYAAIAASLVAWGGLQPFRPGYPPSPADLGAAALQGRDLPQSAFALGCAARAAASGIRDFFSPDAWPVLNACVASLGRPLGPRAVEIEADERMGEAMQALSAFAGHAQEDMGAFAGGRFFDLGRRIERGIAVARLVARFGADDPQCCELLLELGDSGQHARLRDGKGPGGAGVIDLLMRAPGNPRSVACQLQRIGEHLAALPQTAGDGARVPIAARATDILAQLATAEAGPIDPDVTERIASELMKLAEEIVRVCIRPGEGAGAAA